MSNSQKISLTTCALIRRVAVLLFIACVATGCSVRQTFMRGLADELAGQSLTAEDDLDLAREASAYHLKLSEAVLRSDPGHVPLAAAVAGGFTQYAYAFVAFEADRREAADARGAQKLRERAARLYRRGLRHALAAFELQHPGFAAALADPDPARWPRLDPAQVGLAYWAAASWGGLISLSKDDAETLADFPLAARLAALAWAADPAFGDGALASLMGTFEAARPGKNAGRAREYFDRGLEQAAGRSAGAYLAKAEGYALPAGDRAQFVALLEQALAVKDSPGSEMALSNEVMRRRAAWLLERVDELF